MKSKKSLDNVRVLFVDDCPDQQRLYLKMLEHVGANVYLECNGQGAVEVFKRSPSEFDIILMDFKMPILDGLSATRQIRLTKSKVPIIGISACPDDTLEMEWKAAGGDAFLKKPISLEQLVIEIKELSKKSVSCMCPQTT